MHYRDPATRVAFSEALRGWVSAWERARGQFRMPIRDFAKMVGVTEGSFGRWLKGQKIPEPEMCIKLANALGIPAEEVLKIAGHPIQTPQTFEALIQAVLVQGAAWPERSFLMQYLQMTQAPDWRASRSHWKGDAEVAVLSSLDARQKANAVARLIYSWFVDPAREVPIAEKVLPELPSDSDAP